MPAGHAGGVGREAHVGFKKRLTCQRTEPAELGVIANGEDDLAIGCGEHLIGDGVGVRVAQARGPRRYVIIPA